MVYLKSIVSGVMASAVAVTALLPAFVAPHGDHVSIMIDLLVWPIVTNAVLGFTVGFWWRFSAEGRSGGLASQMRRRFE